MNMLLHGLKDAKLEKGDTLRSPKLLTGKGKAHGIRYRYCQSAFLP